MAWKEHLRIGNRGTETNISVRPHEVGAPSAILLNRGAPRIGKYAVVAAAARRGSDYGDGDQLGKTCHCAIYDLWTDSGSRSSMKTSSVVRGDSPASARR
jgi:hypothetical protein